MSEGLNLGQSMKAVPPAGWIAIIGGGLAVGYFINRKNANAQPTVQQPVETGVGVGGTGGFADVNPPTGTGAGTQTNETWRIKATNALIAQGMDPATVDNALRKYLTGQVLNLQEQAIVSSALLQFGVPPESVPGPAPTAPSPVAALTATRTLNRKANEFTINWLPSIGATSYTVTQNSPGEQESHPSAPPNIWQLAPNFTVTFTVTAVNDYGSSEPRTVTFNTGPPPDGGTTQPEAPVQPWQPPTQTGGGPRTYTLVPGDMLTTIALRVYGNANRYVDIYNANQGAIEAAARAHGKASSRGPNGTVGWWIYPGTTITLP